MLTAFFAGLFAFTVLYLLIFFLRLSVEQLSDEVEAVEASP
jgi:hypothetical protein